MLPLPTLLQKSVLSTGSAGTGLLVLTKHQTEPLQRDKGTTWCQLRWQFRSCWGLESWQKRSTQAKDQQAGKQNGFSVNSYTVTRTTAAASAFTMRTQNKTEERDDRGTRHIQRTA